MTHLCESGTFLYPSLTSFFPAWFLVQPNASPHCPHDLAASLLLRTISFSLSCGLWDFPPWWVRGRIMRFPTDSGTSSPGTPSAAPPWGPQREGVRRERRENRGRETLPELYSDWAIFTCFSTRLLLWERTPACFVLQWSALEHHTWHTPDVHSRVLEND